MRIRNSKSQQEIITTDPYDFVAKENIELGLPADQNNSEWLSLVGYADESKPAEDNWQKLSA